MLRWFRLLSVMLAALWLPFSAVAAVTMPFCQHGGQHEQLAHGDHAGMQHDHNAMSHEAMEHDGLAHDTAPAHDGVACDQCGFCHLACAGMMPAQSSSASVLPPAHDFAVSPAPTFPSLTAEPLPRPPRAS